MRRRCGRAGAPDPLRGGLTPALRLFLPQKPPAITAPGSGQQGTSRLVVAALCPCGLPSCPLGQAPELYCLQVLTQGSSGEQTLGGSVSAGDGPMQMTKGTQGLVGPGLALRAHLSPVCPIIQGWKPDPGTGLKGRC